MTSSGLVAIADLLRPRWTGGPSIARRDGEGVNAK
jgi:hypothetical protein